MTYTAQRYDKNSTRILCAGGWVVAMIERLSNDRWVICVGDQRYTRVTFGSANAAFKWWQARPTALAAAARQGGDVQQAPCEAPQSGGEAVTPKGSRSSTSQEGSD